MQIIASILEKEKSDCSNESSLSGMQKEMITETRKCLHMNMKSKLHELQIQTM